MKRSSYKNYQISTALAVALTLVFMTPGFICAEGENVVENDNQQASVEVQSPRPMITNAELGKLSQPPRVEVLEVPKKKESDAKPVELTNSPTENFPFPSPN